MKHERTMVDGEHFCAGHNFERTAILLQTGDQENQVRVQLSIEQTKMLIAKLERSVQFLELGPLGKNIPMTVEELMRNRRWCYCLDETQPDPLSEAFRVSLVIEEELGHFPLGADIPWYWTKETCKARNAALGYSEEDALNIVLSSMFPPPKEWEGLRRLKSLSALQKRQFLDQLEGEGLVDPDIAEEYRQKIPIECLE